jgi:ribosomal 50S subunit-recycling heat shock protein
MRLDLFLKKTRLVKQRTLAKELCAAGLVSVNGQPAKPSQAVRAEDHIHVHMPHRQLDVRVVRVPRGNVARRDIPHLIEVLRDERVDRVDGMFESDAPDPEPDTKET